MTGAVAFNLIVSILVVGGLAAVCRMAFLAAEHWVEEHAAEELPARSEVELDLERAA